MRELTNNEKGAAAEAVVAAEAMKNGITVFRPMSGHSRADLIFEIGADVWRVQVKHAHLTPSGDAIVVHTGGAYLTASGYRRSTYAESEIDLLAAYVSALDRCFLLPPSIFAQRSAVHLRLTPSRNNQQACINLAEEYAFDGAVAQLEERRHGMAEARGSSPLSSTHETSPAPTPARIVGSDEAVRCWGRLLDEVAGGGEVLVTRRGTPKMRLLPPTSGSLVA